MQMNEGGESEMFVNACEEEEGLNTREHLVHPLRDRLNGAISGEDYHDGRGIG